MYLLLKLAIFDKTNIAFLKLYVNNKVKIYVYLHNKFNVNFY